MSQTKLRDTWLNATHRSGEVVELLAPTLPENMYTAIGRINQGLRENEITRELCISLHSFNGNGIKVVRPGLFGDSIPFVPASNDEFGITGAFIDAIGHIRSIMTTESQRAVLDGILINRLRERQEKALTLKLAQTRPTYSGG